MLVQNGLDLNHIIERNNLTVGQYIFIEACDNIYIAVR